jgi:hypothetical protein
MRAGETKRGNDNKKINRKGDNSTQQNVNEMFEMEVRSCSFSLCVAFCVLYSE